MKKHLALLAILSSSAVLAQSSHSVSMSWSAGSGGGTPTGFNVYRTTTSGGCTTVTVSGCSKVGNTASTVTTYTDGTVVGSTTYFYVVTAFNAQGESGPSNQATAAVPPDTPTAPSGLIVTSVK